MLEVKAASLHIEHTSLLTDINLLCVPGTVSVLMGPNGAGKTSLLKAIAGDYKLSSGEISVNGRPLEQWKHSECARFMAVLPQYSTLDFPFSVEEVVLLGRTPHATGLKNDLEFVRAALEKVDASYLSARLYPQLSGGEKQRVQLARVLVQVWQDTVELSPVLLLDEPSASLDLSHQQLLRLIVRDFASRGGTVVMVMHDLNLAAACADQLIMMNCGQVVAAGVPDKLLEAELIQKVFSVAADVIRHPVSGKPLVVI